MRTTLQERRNQGPASSPRRNKLYARPLDARPLNIFKTSIWDMIDVFATGYRLVVQRTLMILTAQTLRGPRADCA